MIRNGFLLLGPNVTGYPGGYPNGYLQALQRLGFWGRHRLHLCAGTVDDGVTVDCKREMHPTVLADLDRGVPFKDNAFDAVIIDPPYSPEMADKLYGLPLLNVPRLLKEAVRVARPNGYVVILDWTVWAFTMQAPRGAEEYALYAVYNANRGPKALRALQVWKKDPRPLEAYDRGQLEAFA